MCSINWLRKIIHWNKKTRWKNWSLIQFSVWLALSLRETKSSKQKEPFHSQGPVRVISTESLYNDFLSPSSDSNRRTVFNFRQYKAVLCSSRRLRCVSPNERSNYQLINMFTLFLGLCVSPNERSNYQLIKMSTLFLGLCVSPNERSNYQLIKMSTLFLGLCLSPNERSNYQLIKMQFPLRGLEANTTCNFTITPSCTLVV